MRPSYLTPGEPAPWFLCPCTTRPDFHFDSVAGRNVVLCFFESAARADSRRILDDFLAATAEFDDVNVSFFGVSTDPEDQRLSRVREYLPGVRFFWDFDRSVSAAFGAAGSFGTDSATAYRPHTILLDRRLRTVGALPFDASPETHVARVLRAVRQLPPFGQPSIASAQAPVLVVPRVFEPALCRMLIEYYTSQGGEDSGFMTEKKGMTVAEFDYLRKRRRDREITDEKLQHSCMVRIHDRLVPEIHKAFQFHATRIERYVVACYDSAETAHFSAHRDNTTKGTAHRRFAVSLHLNTSEYEGGFLRFPEFGPELYAAPIGGAVVFSCSLMHEAMPVTRGRRFMFLPFLYDEAAAQLRDENLRFVAPR